MFAWQAPTDMRKSFNTPSVMGMGHEVTAGDAFVGKCRRRAKVVWAKPELTLFFEESTAVGRIELSPPAFDFERDGRARFSG